MVVVCVWEMATVVTGKMVGLRKLGLSCLHDKHPVFTGIFIFQTEHKQAHQSSHLE